MHDVKDIKKIKRKQKKKSKVAAFYNQTIDNSIKRVANIIAYTDKLLWC